MDQKAPYDLQYLNELSAGDHSFVLEMIKHFCSNAGDSLDRMNDLTTKQDWGSLREVVHKFASNLNLIGLHEAAATSVRLEYITENREGLDQVPDLVAGIRASVEMAVVKLSEDYPFEK